MIQLVIIASASAALIAAAAVADQNSNHENFMASHYPPGALAKGEDGSVGFRIELTGSGRMERCAVIESSGFETLDRETCDFIIQYVNFPAAKDIKGKSQPSVKTGVINWKLPPGVQRSTAPRQAKLQLPQALLCKQLQLTGSNVATATHCMTEREWKLEEQLMRDEIDAFQGRVFCGDHPGCE